MKERDGVDVLDYWTGSDPGLGESLKTMESRWRTETEGEGTPWNEEEEGLEGQHFEALYPCFRGEN